MTSRSPRVLLVQHLEVEPPDRIENALRDVGVTCERCSLERGDVLPDTVGAYAGVVVMGGSMAAYSDENFPTRTAELRLLAACVEREIPTLGVCLGAQLLASACGALVYPGETAELGWRTVEATPVAKSDPLFCALAERFGVLQWHGDTFELPVGAVHLARSALYEHQAFRVGSAAWGLQFHIETTHETLLAWVAGAVATGDLDADLATAILEEAPAREAELVALSSLVLEPFARLVGART